MDQTFTPKKLVWIISPQQLLVKIYHFLFLPSTDEVSRMRTVPHLITTRPKFLVRDQGSCLLETLPKIISCSGKEIRTFM